MVQFYHDQLSETRKTVAVKVPDKIELTKLLALGTEKTIEIQCGYSLVNPKDNYVKSIGREVSKQRPKLIKFMLTASEYNGESIELFLMAVDENSEVNRINLRLLPNASRPHLLFAELNWYIRNK